MIASEKSFFIEPVPSQKFHVNETISSPVSLSTVVDASNFTVKGSVPTVSGVTTSFPIMSALFTLIGITISVFAQLGTSSITSFAS